MADNDDAQLEDPLQQSVEASEPAAEEPAAPAEAEDAARVAEAEVAEPESSADAAESAEPEPATEAESEEQKDDPPAEEPQGEQSAEVEQAAEGDQTAEGEEKTEESAAVEEGAEETPAEDAVKEGEGETAETEAKEGADETTPGEVAAEGEEGAQVSEATEEKAEGEEGAEPTEGEAPSEVEATAEDGEAKAEGEEKADGEEGSGTKSPAPEGEGEGDEAAPAPLEREATDSSQGSETKETSPKPSQEGESDEVQADDESREAGSHHLEGDVIREEDEEQADDAEEQDEEEEEEVEVPTFDRDMLIEKYHAAIAEREQLQQQNYQLQHKLAEYFRKKKSEDSRQEMDKNVTDQEQRYLKYMSTVEDLRHQNANYQEDYEHQIEDLKERCQEREAKVDELRDKFFHFKRQVATNAVNSRSGRTIPPKDIDAYLMLENKKEAEVVNVRLENIKLKNKLKKKEAQLKSKEELAEGLHLIDFEQLKIENQTYNEKIEERNEELLKLRKKITSTVQVLTHLKEKLQYVQAENHVQKSDLREVEEAVGKKRDVLSRTKQARDSLRIDNQKLRQKCGLLGNEPLLRDFEERRDESDALKQNLQQLKTYHAELTLNCAGVRRKIELARVDSAI